MMVRVRNLNIHPYVEKFRDQLISIAPQEAVEMDEDDAEYFLGTAYYPPKKDGQDRPDPKFFKMLKIERDAPRKVEVDHLMVHATGKRAADVSDLKNILSDLAKTLERPEVPEELDRQNKALKKENRKLKTRLEIIEEKLGISQVGGDVEDGTTAA